MTRVVCLASGLLSRLSRQILDMYSAYHCLCYTNHGVLAGMRNSSIGPRCHERLRQTDRDRERETETNTPDQVKHLYPGSVHLSDAVQQGCGGSESGSVRHTGRMDSRTVEVTSGRLELGHKLHKQNTILVKRRLKTKHNTGEKEIKNKTQYR